MKFVIIDPKAREVRTFEGRDPSDAVKALNIGNTDHGTIRRGIGIFVYEYGLYEDPAAMPYFAINGQLYAGTAVLFGYDEAGETVDLLADSNGVIIAKPVEGGFELKPVWLSSYEEVELAIAAGVVRRPEARVNGTLMWRWPDRSKDWMRR